jgi:hypothetical protein
VSLKDLPEITISDQSLRVLSRALERTTRLVVIKGQIDVLPSDGTVHADSLLLTHVPSDQHVPSAAEEAEVIYLGVKDLRGAHLDGLRCLRALPRLPIGLRRQMFYIDGRKPRLDWRFGVTAAQGLLKSIEVFAEDIKLDDDGATVQAERRIVFSLQSNDGDTRSIALENRFCGFGKMFLTASSRRPDGEAMSALRSRIKITQPYQIH